MMNIKPERTNIFIRRTAFWLVAGFLLLCCVTTVQSEQNRVTLPHTVPTRPVTADSIDQATGLIVAPGFVMVRAMCTSCHSTKLITGKRATHDGWLATIRWMQQTQGLWDLGKAEPEILDYLAKYYAPTDEGRRPQLKNIKWYKLEPTSKL